MLIEDLVYFKRTKNYTGKYSGMDHPDRCEDREWFEKYPIQDFDYKYNSWGFRGQEYEQYIGKPVNICLGDSFTVNLGGPIEHSWPSLLQEYFDIPCLNLGMDGAGNDAIRLVCERASEVFDVQSIFVVYSYLHRRLVNGVFQSEPHDHLDNVKYFEQHMIPECIYQFLPHWNYTAEEQEYLYAMAKPYICQTSLKYRSHTNRDGHHMSLKSNQKLVESLIEQWKQS